MEGARPSDLNEGCNPRNDRPLARGGSMHGPVRDRLSGPCASPCESECYPAGAEDMGLLPDAPRESIRSLTP